MIPPVRALGAIRRRPLPAFALIGLLLGLTGCGGSASTSATAGNGASRSVATVLPTAAGRSSATASTASGAGDDCGSAQAEVQAGVGVTGNVTSVEIVGQCTTASVTTSLGTTPDDVDAAVGICRIAANQAYSHGVTTVNVVSSDGKGLAIGLSGGECLAVPKG